MFQGGGWLVKFSAEGFTLFNMGDGFRAVRALGDGRCGVVSDAARPFGEGPDVFGGGVFKCLVDPLFLFVFAKALEEVSISDEVGV